jgi:hypothetical protein
MFVYAPGNGSTTAHTDLHVLHNGNMIMYGTRPWITTTNGQGHTGKLCSINFHTSGHQPAIEWVRNNGQGTNQRNWLLRQETDDALYTWYYDGSAWSIPMYVKSDALISKVNVGIGTASPRWGLEVTPTAGKGGVLSCSDSAIFSHNLYYSGGWKYGAASKGGAYMRMIDSEIQFWNAPNSGSGTWDTAGGAATATQRMTIDESGNVGVGTASPNLTGIDCYVGAAAYAGIQVRSSSGAFAKLIANAGQGGHNAIVNADDVGIIFQADNDPNSDQTGKGFYIAPWAATGPSGIRMNEKGDVGVGIASPTRSLHIKRGTSYPSSGSAVEILQRLGTNNYIYEGQHRAQLRINNQQGTYSNRSLEFALCDNGTGVIQANAGSEGYFPLCLNPGAGNVAIRHMSPSYPLHVAGSAGNMPSMKYFNSGTTNIASGSGDSITIYAAGNIYASGLVAASDERIKKEIVDADDAECLETLRLLKPKRYRYRDEINRGQEPVWGFIAQEVRETLPYATRLSRQAIPNIYELANVSSSNVITFTNFNTSDLEANATTIQVQTAADMEESVTIAEIIDEHAIRVEEDLSNWTGSVDETGNVVTGNQLFVYGQKMDDFVLLKKDAIWTVTTAALQEVDRQLQTEKTKTTTLETELQAEKTKTSTFETELQAEKSKTSTLETKTTTLETKLQEAEAKIATLQAEKEAIRSDLSSLVLRVAALES